MLFEMDRCKKTYTVCLTNPALYSANAQHSLVINVDIVITA